MLEEEAPLEPGCCGAFCFVSCAAASLLATGLLTATNASSVYLRAVLSALSSRLSASPSPSLPLPRPFPFPRNWLKSPPWPRGWGLPGTLLSCSSKDRRFSPPACWTKLFLSRLASQVGQFGLSACHFLPAPGTSWLLSSTKKLLKTVIDFT